MMKLTALAAGLALGLLAAAPVAAQDRHDPNMNPNMGRDRHDQNMSGDRHDQGMRGDRDRDRDQGMRGDRGDRDRGDRGRHMGWREHRDYGHHYGWRNNRHCRWVWRHHRRMRIC
jgi:hypothetical protein